MSYVHPNLRRGQQESLAPWVVVKTLILFIPGLRKANQRGFSKVYNPRAYVAREFALMRQRTVLSWVNFA